MKLRNLSLFFVLIFSISSQVMAQVPMTEFLTFNGRYDFTMFGHSMNTKGNTTDQTFDCLASNVTQSTAGFNLPATSTVARAILYWSGSGAGDFNVKLSGPGFTNMDITAEKTFVANLNVSSGNNPYFSAAYDVTSVLTSFGNGNYTVSELDADRGLGYCPQTLYSGWVIVVVYGDPSLDLNTVKVYDGFDGIRNSSINFNFTGLNIVKPEGSKLGFVVWEGDDLASMGDEEMRVNNFELSNAINPGTEVYNGTNSFSGTTDNHNMDMDVFDISAYVQPGDTNLNISGSTENDFVVYNVFAITFNNEQPDATVRIKNVDGICENPTIDITYTVSNAEGNDVLPAGVVVGFYAGGQLLGSQVTSQAISLGDSLTQVISLTIPLNLGDAFDITAIVDDGNAVPELIETNNTHVYLLLMPVHHFIIDTIFICEGDSLEWGGTYYSEDIYKEEEFSSIYGCDSIRGLDLTTQPPQFTDDYVDLCKGDTLILPDGLLATEDGVYTSLISTYIGCDSTVTTYLTLVNNYNTVIAQASPDSIELGYSTTLIGTTNFLPDSIKWTPGFQLDCDSCLTTLATPYESVTYYIHVIDDWGCPLTDSVELVVYKEDEVFIPNVFSPNNDGFNDFFRIYTDRDVALIRLLQVYDRWGTMVYEAEDFIVGDGPSNWDGTYKGMKLPSDVYIYQVIVEFLDETSKIFSGDITIIR